MTSRRARVHGVAPLLALALGACEAFTEPFVFPNGAARFQPPAQYAAWWRATEQCSGLRARPGDIVWYRVPGDFFPDADGQPVRGSWQGRGAHDDRIFLAAGGVLDGMLVRHEMLHALMARNYLPHRHLREYFLVRCGGVVSCGPECRSQTGSYSQPDGAAPELTGAALERSLLLGRDSIGTDTDSGWVSITVSGRNPRSHAIWVRAPPNAEVFPFTHFGLSVEPGPRTSIRLEDVDARVPVGAGETVRFVFDVPSRELAPGPHRVRGEVLGDSTPVATLVVRP